MSIVTDGLRSDKWRPFAKQKLQMLKDLGLSAKNYAINGYRIGLSTMDGMDKVRITAPPGAVVVAQVAGDYKYLYTDQYGGDFVEYLARQASAGALFRCVFTGVGDLVYFGTIDYFEPDNIVAAVMASWYAPRGNLPGSLVESGGYLAGVAEIKESNPGGAMVGFGFVTERTAWIATAPLTSSSEWSTSIGLSYVYAAGSQSFGVNIDSAYPDFRGRGFYSRPLNLPNGMLTFQFHNRAATHTGPLGMSAVLAYQTTKSGTSLAGVCTQVNLATALGLPVTGGAGDPDGTVMRDAMANVWGDTNPSFGPPYRRGTFAYQTDAICCWYPDSGDVLRGLIVRADGSAEASPPVVIPAYDPAVVQPVVTQVSDTLYLCELWENAAFSARAIYYGSPFGAWTELVHPTGEILRHRMIHADTEVRLALAVVYDSAAGVTVLYEYDASRAVQWAARGLVGAGRVDRPDVAVFGDSAYARRAGEFSPTRRLWR